MVSSNPFATRYTRPGQLEPLDAEGRPIDLPALLQECARLGRATAIVGPHGSGKSTLLRRLHEAAAAGGTPTMLCRITSRWQGTAMPASVLRAARRTLVCVDGWEQLDTLQRLAVRTAARCRGCRLLVTAHRPSRMPTLHVCRPTPVLFEVLVQTLPGAPEWFGSVVSAADTRAAVDRHGGDLREALFHLYDLFEKRRPAARLPNP
jgi:hypothetical protein